jgi:hypothetical protein
MSIPNYPKVVDVLQGKQKDKNTHINSKKE